MKKIQILALVTLMICSISCRGTVNKDDEKLVVIKTAFGNIKVKLYDDTPKHRDNFIKLVSEGFYTDLMFHRVINNFMIQGGDPNSRTASPGVKLGNGGPGYTIPAEILPVHFHKKGVLAAARLGGSSNPMKESSGSQFYIVQGMVFRQGQLDTLEITMNARTKDQLLRENFEAARPQMTELQAKNDKPGFDLCVAGIHQKVDSIYATRPPYKLTPEQRQIYTTVGGYPPLDGEYTVFGEVVEGIEVVDKIAVVETDAANRPKTDVRMNIELAK